MKIDETQKNQGWVKDHARGKGWINIMATGWKWTGAQYFYDC